MQVGGQRHAPAALISRKRDQVPILEEAGWRPGQIWKGAENLAHTRIRSPDRPARSDYASPAIPGHFQEQSDGGVALITHPPPPPSADVKEWVQLYLYSPCCTCCRSQGKPYL
jgi:hypothetical protein